MEWVDPRIQAERLARWLTHPHKLPAQGGQVVDDHLEMRTEWVVGQSCDAPRDPDWVAGRWAAAVRPFLERDPEGTLAVMLQWTRDDNEHVRRLASEGCRPRLPWAPALPAFKEDPEPLLPILEALKDDPAEYVRRSVANNLNDISKDHPDRVLDIAAAWFGVSEGTDWIVKHACRTLLKAGDPRAMRIFGFADPARLRVEALQLSAASVAIGGHLHFEFELHNDESEPRKVRLEYRVDYVKARGKRSGKVFQIKESELVTGRHSVKRKLSVKDLSTRKHHPGTHGLAIIVNGVEKATGSFELTAP